MPQGHDFIFFLQDAKRRFWGLNSSGEVVIGANPYPLVFAPDGWDDIVIKNVRNRKYWAISRQVSAPFKYVEDGAKILKHIYYKYGVEASVFLVICEQRLEYTAGVEYGYWYKQIFRSEVDLSTFEHVGPVVTAATMEEGLAKHLKANENTVYELDLDTFVKLDGITLRHDKDFLVTGGQEVTGTDNFFMGMYVISGEGNFSDLAFFDVNFQSSQPYPNNEYFLRATGTREITITGEIEIYYNKSVTPFIRLEVNDGEGSGSTQYVLFSAAGTAGETVTATINQTFTIPAGSRAHIKLFGGSPSDSTPQFTIQESNLKMEYDYRYPATYVKWRRPQDVFADLVMKMTGGEYTAEDCPYFGELQNWDKVFTSGDAIRGVEGAKLKISFAQFFEFWETYDAVGIRGKNNQVLFDRKAVLTDNTNRINLGSASKLKVKFDKSFPFNELAIGYPDVKNENGFVNGKNEVNTTFNFSLGTTKTPRKLDKTCKIKASCYDIENIRIEGANKDTTDNRSDNDVYVVHIADTLVPASGDIPAHYELDRTYNAYVTGVDQADTVFNLALSPKNCFLNSGDYIRSCFFKNDNKTFRFTSADRNKEMAYVNGSTVIVESADVPVGNLASPFFTPPVIEIDVSPPEDLLDDLDDNPAMGFEFDFEGETYKGVHLETSLNPGANKKQTYQLLNHPDNDLEKLIDYYG